MIDIDLKEIKKHFCFHHLEGESEIYFCSCGKKITKENNKAKEDEITIELDEDLDEDIMDKFDSTINVICPKCKVNYSKSKNLKKIKESNSYFYGYFKCYNNDDELILYKKKIKSSCTLKSRYVNFKELESYISINKKEKTIFYKSYEKSKKIEFNLDELLFILEKFYNSEELSVLDNLVEIHYFLNNLAGLVVDSKNMDIVENLMSQMLGKPGVDIMMKINTIFFGIICYSNLSTIALTKGTVFLYDMMYSCKLPNVSVLSDENVTSPINIFNFLVSLENEVIQKEIDSETLEDEKFVYKSKDGKSKSIFYDLKRWGFKGDSKISISDGKINVREDLKSKSVSKFIFNKIEKFDDYKNLIKFTKFITYEELIGLVMKYDIQYIISLFKLVEFRDDINMVSLKQIIPLTLDFLRNRKSITSKAYTLGIVKKFAGIGSLEDLNSANLEDEPTKLEDVELNYSFLEQFSFYNYDDSIRMISGLNWDRNKEFNKIKTISEINSYHDKIVEHYNMLSDEEKNEKFKKFAKKFKYLEDYDGNLKIKLLSTPKMVLNAAKDLKNCAGSYITRISKGRYILMMIYDKSNERGLDEMKEFMIGFNVNQSGLEFEQLKGVCNRLTSDRQKKKVMKYLEDKDISYKEVRDLKVLDKER